MSLRREKNNNAKREMCAEDLKIGDIAIVSICGDEYMCLVANFDHHAVQLIDLENPINNWSSHSYDFKRVLVKEILNKGEYLIYQ